MAKALVVLMFAISIVLCCITYLKTRSQAAYYGPDGEIPGVHCWIGTTISDPVDPYSNQGYFVANISTAKLKHILYVDVRIREIPLQSLYTAYALPTSTPNKIVGVVQHRSQDKVETKGLVVGIEACGT